jgi:hypothetical protein
MSAINPLLRNALATVIGLSLAASFCAAASAQGMFTFSPLLQAPQLLTTAQPIVQANGASVRTPLGRIESRRSKLWLTVDTRWANGYGYRPIVVTAASAKPVATDRTVTIQLFSGWGNVVSARQTISLPAGSTSATATISMPQYQINTMYNWWDVWVDGAKDKDLSLSLQDSLSRITGGASSGAAGAKKFLVLGPPQNNRTLVSTTSAEFEILSLNMAEFPVRWIDYTCFDVVALSASELQTFSQSNPAAFAAMRHWIIAGGQLWLSDAGAKLEQIPAISRLIQLKPTVVEIVVESGTEQPDRTESATGETAWRPAVYRRNEAEGLVVTFQNINTGMSRVERDPDVVERLRADGNFTVISEHFDATVERRGRRRVDSKQWFVQQPLGLGMVRAFRGKNEVGLISQATPLNPNVAVNQGTPDVLPPALNVGLRTMRSWKSRHGIAPDEANVEFANLLVPGVGLAPVTEFRVLITVFVLVIGPLNYWLLKRFRRLQLLVLTVPLAAIMTSAALFAYAITSDGFRTSVRAHSVTRLDQQTGEAACWNRLSYYSGMAPSGGLTFPADVVVYPIIPGWVGDWNVAPQRDLQWNSNEYQLTRGWLSSRTPTQMLTVRSRKTSHRIELLSSGEDKLRATNQLGTPISFLLVIGDGGDCFLGEQLATDSRAQLQPISRQDAIGRLRKIITDNAPQPPPELAGSDSNFAQRQQRRYRRYGPYGLEFSTERLQENLVWYKLQELAGLTSAPALDLPPRSYFAVTATGPEVVLGTPDAIEDASFHVILGNW